MVLLDDAYRRRAECDGMAAHRILEDFYQLIETNLLFCAVCWCVVVRDYMRNKFSSYGMCIQSNRLHRYNTQHSLVVAGCTGSVFPMLCSAFLVKGTNRCDLTPRWSKWLHHLLLQCTIASGSHNFLCKYGSLIEVGFTRYVRRYVRCLLYLSFDVWQRLCSSAT